MEAIRVLVAIALVWTLSAYMHERDIYENITTKGQYKMMFKDLILVDIDSRSICDDTCTMEDNNEK